MSHDQTVVDVFERSESESDFELRKSVRSIVRREVLVTKNGYRSNRMHIYNNIFDMCNIKMSNNKEKNAHFSLFETFL